MITNKMINPTHRDVKINWDKGINIFVPADGQIDLTLEQMDDYREGKPGSEEVREQTEIAGVFLLDGDRGYDEQALEALRKCRKRKEDQLRAFVDRLRDSRIATGSPVDEAALEEAKRRSGYDVFEKDIETLAKRIQILERAVSSNPVTRVKEQLDPKKTCFATNPPKEFASETALEVFLVDKPEEFIMKHKEIQSQMLED